MGKEKASKATEGDPRYKVSTLWESDFGSVILADGGSAFPFVLARVERSHAKQGWGWSAGTETGQCSTRREGMVAAEQALIRMCEKWVKLLTMPQVPHE